MNDADRQLSTADPALRRLIEAGGPIHPDEDRRGSRADPYEALARAIVGQQLSTKAAASIWEKLLAVFGGETPAPEQLLEADPQALRDAGLSWPKVNYVRDLAEHIADGELDLGSLPQLSDAEVVAELTRIKGVGVWTAEMFLIFHLGSPDVLPVGDLGIRRAVQIAYGLDDLPDPERLEQIGEPWRPHRSLASLYLWESLAAAPDA